MKLMQSVRLLTWLNASAVTSKAESRGVAYCGACNFPAFYLHIFMKKENIFKNQLIIG